MANDLSVDVIIPAAGTGKRMGAAIPKQYLEIGGRTVLERTISVFLSYPRTGRVIVCLREDDTRFEALPCAADPRIVRAAGGEERVDSVLSGLEHATAKWVMVHDAARPCLAHQDLDRLLAEGMAGCGGILGTACRDTMKRTDSDGNILSTVDRTFLFHAHTPQLFQTRQLAKAIKAALADGVNVTDEASAMEHAGFRPKLVEGRSDNIKITRPSDLTLARFILEELNQ